MSRTRASAAGSSAVRCPTSEQIRLAGSSNSAWTTFASIAPHADCSRHSETHAAGRDKLVRLHEKLDLLQTENARILIYKCRLMFANYDCLIIK